mmetsp:Transcript_11210/g.16511  ORF Transcript_11210/g.16511 Transcript_11210/m.16511 type:complete len:242 (-) Transcript_11210:537-1262(-)
MALQKQNRKELQKRYTGPPLVYPMPSPSLPLFLHGNIYHAHHKHHVIHYLIMFDRLSVDSRIVLQQLPSLHEGFYQDVITVLHDGKQFVSLLTWHLREHLVDCNKSDPLHFVFFLGVDNEMLLLYSMFETNEMRSHCYISVAREIHHRENNNSNQLDLCPKPSPSLMHATQMALHKSLLPFGKDKLQYHLQVTLQLVWLMMSLNVLHPLQIQPVQCHRHHHSHFSSEHFSSIPMHPMGDQQ